MAFIAKSGVELEPQCLHHGDILRFGGGKRQADKLTRTRTLTRTPPPTRTQPQPQPQSLTKPPTPTLPLPHNQLGLGAAGAKCTPTLLLAERGSPLVGQPGGEAAASGAGWGHTVLLLRQPR